MATSKDFPPSSSLAYQRVEVVVLGAGMSGLCMGIELKRSGIDDFLIIEKQTGIGGTWWDNIYPGAHVDLPSPLYCFSFEPNPYWKQRFAAASEIQSYMQGCIKKYGLEPYLRLETKIVSASFNELRGMWEIDIINANGQQRIETRFFVCSTGPLSQVRWPDIPGLETFKGRRLHSARWDPAYSAEGQRVAVIGTGSTGCQLIPKIAEQAKSLFVLQRTANWVMPRLDRQYSPIDHKLAQFPPYAWVVRRFWYAFMELTRNGFNKGTVMRSLMMRTAAFHMNQQVSNIGLRKRLKPNYPLGCKRIIFSSDFYPAICQPNVELVTDPIDYLTADSFVTASGRNYQIDTLVCATGFETTRLLSALSIYGLAGRSLNDVWADSPQAYKGVAVAEFPNLFFLLGPNTATAHTSTLLYIEPQTRHVVECIQKVRQGGYHWISVRPEIQKTYNQNLQYRLSESVWSMCNSWYRNKNGRIVMLWPGTTDEYVKSLENDDFTAYSFVSAKTANA